MSRINMSIEVKVEKNTAFSSTLLTKSFQSTLFYLLTKMMILGKDDFTIHQRVLARKLVKHYNTIYLALQKLQEFNYLQERSENTQTLVQINLDKLFLPSMLALLNRSFSQKMLTFDLFQIFAEKKQKNQESIFDDEQINEQALVILEKKKELAEILAQELLVALKEAYKTAQQVLDFDDYSVIISQVFKTIPEHLGTTFVQKKSFNLPKDINYKNAKLGKL